jgi:CubicO group peptidase (beta-lactamase class C family)
VQWGGLAGTHWWFSPEHNIAELNMTQRMFGFWNPYAFKFKQLIYNAVL